MARTAVTISVSMPPEVRDLLEALREESTPSEYVRRLVETDAARRALDSPELALAEVARAQAELPAAWLHEDLGDPLEDARRVPEVDGLVGADVYAGDLSLQDLKPASF
jgi:hypothetical protein